MYNRLDSNTISIIDGDFKGQPIHSVFDTIEAENGLLLNLVALTDGRLIIVKNNSIKYN